MDKWIERALEKKQIACVSSQSDFDGVFCVAHQHEWYDDGVVMDWSALHRGLRPTASSFAPAAAVAELLHCVCTSQGEGASLATSLELQAPQCIIPLAEQAQRLSVFLHPHGSGGKPYKFCRGPPGQRSVRDDICAVLRSVQQQLQSSGIRCCVLFSSVGVISNDFEQLMHHTAAVYRALKGAGIEMNANASAFEPRRVLRTAKESFWNTLSLSSLTRTEDMASFLVDLFYMWLNDWYLWLCETPPQSLLQASGKEDEKLKIFRGFLGKRLLPHVDSIEFTGLSEVEVDDLITSATPLLLRKLPPVGPQKWSALELRLCLAAIKAYEYSPSD